MNDTEVAYHYLHNWGFWINTYIFLLLNPPVYLLQIKLEKDLVWIRLPSRPGAGALRLRPVNLEHILERSSPLLGPCWRAVGWWRGAEVTPLMGVVCGDELKAGATALWMFFWLIHLVRHGVEADDKRFKWIRGTIKHKETKNKHNLLTKWIIQF